MTYYQTIDTKYYLLINSSIRGLVYLLAKNILFYWHYLLYRPTYTEYIIQAILYVQAFES